jgi:actin-like ATPase involved in cell morphogenesis
VFSCRSLIPVGASEVTLTGGISLVEGVKNRLASELGVDVVLVPSPLLSAWLGAVDLAQQDPPEFTLDY